MSKNSLIAFACVAVLAGCNSRPAPSNDKAEVAASSKATPERSVADVAAALKDQQVTAVDANNIETRQKYGVVPGAVLLSDHRSYALSELPSDKAKPLVFYCGGTQCRASDAAASKAMSAGYANVSVMRDGIRGWADAGQPTTTLPKS
jgi:rhodanese-related sulfurtransferase